MISDQITLPYLWRRYLSLLRALLGASCLWVVLGSSRFEQATFLLALLLLTVYSLVSTFWRWPDRADRLGLVALTADLAMFFLCVWLTGRDGFWVTAFAAFYVLLSAASLHEWRQVLLAVVISMTFVNVVQPPHVERLQPLLLLLGMMGCVLALQKHSLLERLSNASKQSVLYRAEAQMARESEKERIAADFHDGPLQSFISFQLGLETVRRRMERDPAAGLEELRELREICDKQVKEMRTFVRSMRPVAVAGAGLATAVRSMVASFQKDTRIPAVFKADAEASHDDFASSTDLLQVIREALNNIQKHSNASRVTVTLERTGSWLAVTVVDDGTGFPFVGKFTLEEMDSLLIGPASIKSRIRAMGGDLEVESRPGTGSTLRIRVPV
ncbi:MAG TPA: sensor histidine kinase [Bryobacteraceae bacterium]|nr:sensor histidine kinase [Bryobacteraceae bacterium]HPT29014.1 sensor histidine kinase [Bryobacteraceae bacterium]